MIGFAQTGRGKKMNDLISRKEAIEWVQNILATHLYYHPCSKSRNVPIDEVIDRLERQPSIDAVKHGIWIEENTRPRSSQFYCSVCHRTAYDPQPTRIDGWVKRCRYAYCPNCGARMDGEEDG